MSIEGVANTPPTEAWPMAMRPPPAGFYAAFRSAHANLEAASPPRGAEDGSSEAGQRLLAGLLGQTHAEMSRRRGVSEADQSAYEQLLQRAYTEGAFQDPASFLRGLSATELGVVQRNHGLAQAIDPVMLSREGASNLLLPEGYALDLDGNDVIETGIGRRIAFPPANAPAAFTKAWASATQGMNPGDAASYGLSMFMYMHRISLNGDHVEANLPGDALNSYQQVVRDALDGLEAFRAHLAEGQYVRDKAFFTRLLAAMG